MWPDRRLTELFEIEHPLVLAPMAGLGTIGLAASVCEAGGLGSLGCATMQPQLVAKTIQELRALTSKPINVNFFCHAQAKSDPDREHAWQDRLLPYFRELGIDCESPRSRLDIPPFGDAMCTVVEDAKPEVVSFHFGLPAPALLARVKAAGCRVMSSATTVEEALWLEAGGVDAIIAQGYEAGGHRGMFLAANLSSAIVSQPGTLPLVPQIVDAVRLPVIAAGGIADGRGIAAAFALGAAGTQLGTAYLLCPEAATPPLYRDALRHARGDATLMTNVFSGRPARILVNRLALDVGPILDAPLDFPFPMAELQPLRAKAEQEGRTDFTPFWSGQAAPMGREMPAKALTVKLATEALERFKQLGGLSKSGPSPLTVI
ncbi:MAG: nitronate monooxygenase [Xanthobacteraceae bacterium]|jgi:nitronate monooxygenase